jgi:nucleotide-binding universal stress UspA family protein
MVTTSNKTIVLYGKRNSITASLKYNLEKQIIKYGRDIDLIEIDDPAAFIREDIRQLPCVVINNRKHYYHQTDDLKTFITKIIHETMPNSNRNFVNQVIVPVDFSDYSRNSFYQAFKLARKLNANITMVHVYAPVVVPAEGVLYIDPDLQKDVNARFNQFVDELEKSLTETDRAAVHIDRIFRVGMVTNELQEMVKTMPGSMLVLSTSGTGQKIKEILGSISLWVVKHAQCPILLIPPDVHDLNFERILFASDHFGMYDDAISAIRYYSVSPEATIDVVHVFEEGSEYMQKDAEMRHELEDQSIREVILFDDDFPGTIQKYLKTQAIDLLVMERKDRGFWKELFHTSMTRKMAVYSEVPMLILHEDQIVQFRSQ